MCIMVGDREVGDTRGLSKVGAGSVLNCMAAPVAGFLDPGTSTGPITPTAR